MLKHLSVQDYEINSLIVMDPGKRFSGSVHYEDFKDLNMRSLEYLTLTSISWREAEIIMDLALRSTHEEMVLNVQKIGTVTESFLRHDLIKRVYGMYLTAGKLFGVLC
jgi:hypothetical protein